MEISYNADRQTSAVRLIVPERLAATCRTSPDRTAWLERLPENIRELEDRWRLTLGEPFDGASGAWVAPVTLIDGTKAVLKVGMPHLEALHEIEGLRFWNGNPTIRLLDADVDLNAMLLERCEPGTPLRVLPETNQDVVIAQLLRRLWRTPRSGHPFRSLDIMLDHWREEAVAEKDKWVDSELVSEGLRLFEKLSQQSDAHVLLATDLHAGNVLRAQREPWLVIDPKPFLGDPAYDATQHLLNCKRRLHSNPTEMIRRFVDLVGVDEERVRHWMFARVAVENRLTRDDDELHLARKLAPS